MKKVFKVFTKKEFEIIEGLRKGLTIVDISKLRKTSRTSTYKILDRLKRKGYITNHSVLRGLINHKNPRGFYLTQKTKNILRLNGEDVSKKKIQNYCEVCGYFLIVNKHHIDSDRKHNHESNLINLCPNHHYLLHIGKAYLREINDRLCYVTVLDKSLNKAV